MSLVAIPSLCQSPLPSPIAIQLKWLIDLFSKISTCLFFRARVSKVKSKSDVPQPEILLNLRDRTVVEGMSVRFNCRTSSTPKPYVLWYKDDHAIGSYGRYEISSMSGTQSLVIRDCQVGDVGTYKCQVTNLGGEAHTTARLTVEGNNDFRFFCVCIFCILFYMTLLNPRCFDEHVAV